MLDEEKALIGTKRESPIGVRGHESQGIEYWDWRVEGGPQAECELLREKFRQAATEAGILLPAGVDATQPLVKWCQALYAFCIEIDWQDLREYVGGYGPHPNAAYIGRAFEVSTTYCALLHRKAMEREAMGSENFNRHRIREVLKTALTDSSSVLREALTAQPQLPEPINLVVGDSLSVSDSDGGGDQELRSLLDELVDLSGFTREEHAKRMKIARSTLYAVLDGRGRPSTKKRIKAYINKQLSANRGQNSDTTRTN